MKPRKPKPRGGPRLSRGWRAKKIKRMVANLRRAARLVTYIDANAALGIFDLATKIERRHAR